MFMKARIIVRRAHSVIRVVSREKEEGKSSLPPREEDVDGNDFYTN